MRSLALVKRNSVAGEALEGTELLCCNILNPYSRAQHEDSEPVGHLGMSCRMGRTYAAICRHPGCSNKLSLAALAPGGCLRRPLRDPRSQQPQIQEWQQKHGQCFGCAARSSAALAPRCCLRHILDHPRSQRPQIQEGQQKHCQLLGCAGLVSAALAPGCCLRQLLDHPRSQQPQIQEWQQKHKKLRGCAQRPSAVLAPGCCLRRILVHPSPPWPCQANAWLVAARAVPAEPDLQGWADRGFPGSHKKSIWETLHTRKPKGDLVSGKLQKETLENQKRNQLAALAFCSHLESTKQQT